MIARLGVVVPWELRGELWRALNKLHGFENGGVPMDADVSDEHMKAGYRLAEQMNGLKVDVDISVDAEGNVKAKAV